MPCLAGRVDLWRECRQNADNQEEKSNCLSVNDCGNHVEKRASGGNSKENARCLSNAEYCDKGDEKDGGNVKK